MKLEDLRPLSGNGKRLYVETYGCQMNVGDSEILVSIMQDEGYRYTEDIAQADVILVNTCSIRDNAEQRIWGRLREFHRYKKGPQGARRRDCGVYGRDSGRSCSNGKPSWMWWPVPTPIASCRGWSRLLLPEVTE